MSDQSLNLVRNVTTISVALDANSTIYNADSVNAVWVSPYPSVAPGIGMRIGPKGSLVWNNRTACYGVADTGVTSPVPINVSTSISQLTNPIDVATAVAAQLLATGIPSVFVGDLLYNQIITVNSGSFVLPNFVDRYASLSIKLISRNRRQRWTVDYYDEPSGVTTYSKDFVQGYYDNGATGMIQLDSVVRGDRLRINWTDTTEVNGIIILVYGSNRQVKEGITQIDTLYGSSLPSQSFSQFTSVTLPDVFYTNGGVANVYIATNSTTATGYLEALYLDASGAFTRYTLASVNVAANGPYGESTYQGQITMPAGVYQLAWKPGTPGAPTTYSLSLNIIPQN